MKMQSRTLMRVCVGILGLFIPTMLFAASGGIDAVDHYSRLCKTSDCTTYSVVNWKPTNATVTVEDSRLTGYIWSANLGWINLSPTHGGVSNTTAGTLSGYAWGEVGSWVNFSPAKGGVHIDPDTGVFSGYAWVSNAGWMLFDCARVDACVKTNWRGSSSTGDTGGDTGGGSTGGGGGDTGGGDTGTGGDTTGGDTGGSGDTGTGDTAGGDTGGGDTGGGTTGGDTGGTGDTGGGGGFVVLPEPTPSIVPAVTSVYKTAIEDVVKATQTIKNVVQTKAGTAVTRTVGVVGVVGGTAVSVTTGLFLTPISFSDFLLIPIRLWSLLLGAVGLAKRKKPWGTVYDSVTKQPLDPAYVVLRTIEGKDVATAITDLDGRYGFVVPEPGTYTLIANKTNYLFPSQKLVGHDHDELYRDLYFGEHFSIATAGEVITRNIPMDPVNFDWNEFAKRKQHLLRFYSDREKWLVRFSNLFFYIGFTVASVTVLSVTNKYNVIVFGLYVALFFVRQFTGKTRPFGSVVSAETGVVIPFAIVRISQAGTGVEVMHRVADARGHYYALLPNGSYTVRIDQKLADATYKTVAAALPVQVKEGYLSEVFKVTTAEITPTAPTLIAQPPVAPPTETK